MNNLVNKIGLDKCAHFGIGGLICAMFTLIFMIQDFNSMTYTSVLLMPFTGYVVTAFVSVIKEYFFDAPHSDWKDIVAGMLGCVAVHLAVCIGVLFNVLSHNTI